eukprot:scaffold12534_cov63-Attheya_sp.AAC.2
MGTGASAVYLNQQRSNELMLTNEQLLGIVSKTVRLELFHHVKFVTSPNELDWGQPIQRWIFQKVNFSEDKSLKDFWAKHCRCVLLTLNKKRGNVTTAEVKSSFIKMMKEFDAAEEVRPTKENMLTMGENENNACNTFCDYILPAVCGRKSNEAKFNKDYLSKVATVSDEAFALLSIENAWDRWGFQLDNPESDHIPALYEIQSRGIFSSRTNLFWMELDWHGTLSRLAEVG